MEVDGHEEKEALELDKLRRGLSSSSTTERRAWLEHLHQRIGHLGNVSNLINTTEH